MEQVEETEGNVILKQLLGLEEELIECFVAFNTTGKKLKRIRVIIKELRAYLGLTAFLFPSDFDYDEFNDQIKDFYKVAGSLRDTKLQRKFFEKEVSDAFRYIEYCEHLDHEYIQAEETLEEIDTEPVQQVTVDLIRRLIAVFENMEVQYLKYKSAHYLSVQEEVYFKALENISVEEDIHTIRKVLKQIFFISNLMDISIFNKSLMEQKRRLKEIGNWNDKVVRIAFLHDFLIDHIHMVKQPKYYTQFLSQDKKEADQLLVQMFGVERVKSYLLKK